MKIYTHYTKITEKEGFRWRTLLQFGNSWDILGSVVMKNPGSASVSCPVADAQVLQALHFFDGNKTREIWYEFTPDPTMYCVRDLFSEYHSIHTHEELNGVIQIFNLLYIRDAHLERALQKVAQLALRI